MIYRFNSSLDSSWKNGPIPWQPDSNEYKSYGYALKSGKVGKNEISYINKSVTGPGNITFWWKKSSCLYSSTDLRFLVDNVTKKTYDDYESFGWQKESYDIGAGTHELSWAFELKDCGNRYNPAAVVQVAGWLDDIEINTTPQQAVYNGIVYVDNIKDLRRNINNSNVNTIILKRGKYNGSLYLNRIIDKKLKSEIPFQAEIISNKTDLYVIGLERSSHVCIMDLELNGPNGGIYLEDSSFCSISGNKIIANTRNAINLKDCIGNNINYNTIKKLNKTNCSIRLECNSRENNITNNYFEVPDLSRTYLVYVDNSCDNKIYNISNGYVYDEIMYYITNNRFSPLYSGCNHWW